MKRTARKIGTLAFWLGWPVYLMYFKLSKRTRVLLTQGDQVLVVANWISDGRWNLPGGGLHRNEDPEEGALRELREEVGVVLPKGALHLLGTEIYEARGHKYAYFQFTAAMPEDQIIKCQWYEVADAQWMHPQDLSRHNATPDVLAVLAKWHHD